MNPLTPNIICYGRNFRREKEEILFVVFFPNDVKQKEQFPSLSESSDLG